LYLGIRFFGLTLSLLPSKSSYPTTHDKVMMRTHALTRTYHTQGADYGFTYSNTPP